MQPDERTCSVPVGGNLQARYLEEIYSRQKAKPGLFFRLKTSFHLQFFETPKDEDLTKYCKEKRIGEIRQTSHSGPTQAELIQASLRRRDSVAQGTQGMANSGAKERPMKTADESSPMKQEGPKFVSSPAVIDADEFINSRWEQCQQAVNGDFESPKSDDDAPIGNGTDQQRLPGSLQAGYLSEAMKSQKKSIVSTSPACGPIQHVPKEFGEQDGGCIDDLQGNTGVLQASALERALHRRRSTITERGFGWWRS